MTTILFAQLTSRGAVIAADTGVAVDVAALTIAFSSLTFSIEGTYMYLSHTILII